MAVDETRDLSERAHADDVGARDQMKLLARRRTCCGRVADWGLEAAGIGGREAPGGNLLFGDWHLASLPRRTTRGVKR